MVIVEEVPVIGDTCAFCQRRMRPSAQRYLTDTHVIVCRECVHTESPLFSGSLVAPTTGNPHKITHPDCPIYWHDVWDHSLAAGNARQIAVLRQVLPATRWNGPNTDAALLALGDFYDGAAIWSR